MKSPIGNLVQSRAMLLMCSVDLPARAMVLNMKQFNGKYSCCFCEDEGRPRPNLPQCRDWPFNTSSTTRTSISLRQNAQESIQKNDAVSVSIYFVVQKFVHNYFVYIC